MVPELPGSRGLLPTRDGVIGYRAHLGPSGAAVSTLVLVHGWGGSADVTWWGVLRHLQTPFVAIDLPGHGKSRIQGAFSIRRAAEMVVELVEALEVPNPLLVGYSLGGPVAMEAARSRPGLFCGMIGLATSLYWSRPRTRALARAGPYVFGAPVSLGRALYRNRARVQPELAPFARWNLSALPGRPVLVEASTELCRFDGRSWAAGLGLPIMWAVTTRDTVVAPHQQRESARLLGASVIELQATHSCSHLAPTEVAEALNRLQGALHRSVGGNDEGPGELGASRR